MTSPHTDAQADAPETDPEDESSGSSRSTTRSVIEWIAVIGGALIVALIIKTFLIQAFYIPSGSMETTLDIGDRVLVNKLSYRVHDVNRGDLVVFEANEGAGDCGQPVSDAAASASESGIKDLIKRVIGLPGDTINCKGGVLYRNGNPVKEPYLDPGTKTESCTRTTVPQGELFVMGDNRENSQDSRVFGPIERSDVVGRAFVRIWPLNHTGWLRRDR